ncbi:hypothetical protein [Vreelandella maris]|uniref:hypothetical protein n=1 Tax=Vreelandella maris TaxID=2729617 RepID=UPI0030EEBB08|tara:strand:+ start:48 stop:473 length:426 start_codon:yes stop_codon:yes gene_type:complete
MFELNSYDADSFETGVWSAVQGDSELKVARAGNAEYLRELEKLEKSFRKEHGEKLEPQQRHSLNCQAIARGLLKDWRNVTENGKVIEYTPEVGAKYLKRNPKLLSFVLDRANDLERWEKQDLESQVGKPANSSASKASSKE